MTADAPTTELLLVEDFIEGILKKLLIIATCLFLLVLGIWVSKVHSLSSRLSKATKVEIYTQTVPSNLCSKKFVFTEQRMIKESSSIIAKSAIFPSEVMPCGYNVVVDFIYDDTTKNIRVRANTECGYISSDYDGIGKWKRYNSQFNRFIEITELEGFDDEFCPSP